MHLLTNEIKLLHLHFPYFSRQLEQCCLRFSSRHIELFPANDGNGLADLQVGHARKLALKPPMRHREKYLFLT